VYSDFEDAEQRIFRASATGGPRLRLYDAPASRPAISPDGTRVAFVAGSPRRIVGVPIDGGAPFFDLLPPPGTGARVAWAPDGRALTIAVRERGVDDLWRLPVDGSPPRRLTDLGDLGIFRFAWSPDGRLVLSRGTRRRDAVLLTAGSS
jgi:TolB protein